MLAQLPGFQDPVHDSQRTFRSLLNALARPGILQTAAPVVPPLGLEPACAAACLTLLDLETSIWLQPGLSNLVKDWLLFHTGCRFIANPSMADFALIADLATAPDLEAFNWGSPEYPETSTSLLMQLPNLQEGAPITLEGPGILNSITIAPQIPGEYWNQWRVMTEAYPLGVDGWCLKGEQVLGLPRSTRLSSNLREE